MSDFNLVSLTKHDNRKNTSYAHSTVLTLNKDVFDIKRIACFLNYVVGLVASPIFSDWI
jgi:hypothetical protein